MATDTLGNTTIILDEGTGRLQVLDNKDNLLVCRTDMVIHRSYNGIAWSPTECCIAVANGGSNPQRPALQFRPNANASSSLKYLYAYTR